MGGVRAVVRGCVTSSGYFNTIFGSIWFLSHTDLKIGSCTDQISLDASVARDKEDDRDRVKY